MKRWLRLGLLLAAVLVVTISLARADEWDDLDQPVDPQIHAQDASEREQEATPASSDKPAPKDPGLRGRALPVTMVVFLAFSILVVIFGGRANAKRTLAFEEHFCKAPDGVLWKQFERLGKGPSKLLVSETASTFKLHANGHQHIEAAVLTMSLLHRHEVVSYISQRIGRHEDMICMELFLKDGSMPPMVVAVATPATQRELLQNYKDVKLLAPKMEVKEDRIRDWPRDDLVVFAEHPSYFYDMMTKPMLAQVFGGVAFPRHKAYFRGLQISSDGLTSHPKVMRFWLALPPAERMDELQTLLRAAFAMVAQVGAYSISPERQKQAEQARQEFVKSLSRKEQNTLAKEAVEMKRGKQKRK